MKNVKVVLVCVLAYCAAVTSADENPPPVPTTLAATVKGRSGPDSFLVRGIAADVDLSKDTWTYKASMADLSGRQSQTIIHLVYPRSESSVTFMVDPATDTCEEKRDPADDVMLSPILWIYPGIYDQGCTLSKEHVSYGGVDCNEYTCVNRRTVPHQATLYYSTEGKLPMGGSFEGGKVTFTLSDHTTKVDISSMTKYGDQSGPCMNPPADLVHPEFTAVYSLDGHDVTVYAVHHRGTETSDFTVSWVREDAVTGGATEIIIDNGPGMIEWTYDPDWGSCTATKVLDDMDNGFAFLSDLWKPDGTKTYRDPVTGADAECEVWSRHALWTEDVWTSCIADGQVKWHTYTEDMGNETKHYTLKSYKQGAPDMSLFAKPSDNCPDHPSMQ